VAGDYRELLNSDSGYYGGSDLGNSGHITTQDAAADGFPHSLSLTLPPLGGIILKLQQDH
jgi:1,4-alpha-glucan branching enzyme